MRASRTPMMVVLSACLGLRAANAQPYPEPAPVDPSDLGVGVQRTMTLLATSTPERPNRVRILFYGQSITTDAWTRPIVDDLRARFPHAIIESENRALAGFSSQRLVRTADYDLYPYYPDLLVLHVYGSHIEYENLIERTRRRTTAEIVMQSDHVTRWPEEASGTNPWKWPWTENWNRNLLPTIARKYDVPFVNIRGWWLDYLKANGYEPSQLLKDQVHLNAHGNFLMSRLLSRYLVHRPDIPERPWSEWVRDSVVGRDLDWDGDRLTLEFDGNRVDVVAGMGQPGSARVLIDGRPPADFPDLYYHARPSGTPGIGWPAIKRIGWEKPLQAETWTVACTGWNEKQDDFQFNLTGSVTGPDGSGRGTERFVSNSGRVVIESADWSFAYDREVSKRAAPATVTVTWQTRTTFVDPYETPENARPGVDVTTLVLGLPNTRHRLELLAEHGKKPPVEAIRVYRPPLR